MDVISYPKEYDYTTANYSGFHITSTHDGSQAVPRGQDKGVAVPLR